MPGADRIMQGKNRKVGYEHNNRIYDEQLKHLQGDVQYIYAHINMQLQYI